MILGNVARRSQYTADNRKRWQMPCREFNWLSWLGVFLRPHISVSTVIQGRPSLSNNILAKMNELSEQ